MTKTDSRQTSPPPAGSGKRSRKADTHKAENGLAVRQAAHAILHGILDKNRLLDQAFEQAFLDPAFRSLEERDRAFVRAIIMATLRNLGQIDRLLDDYLTKPMPDRMAGIRHILRVGLGELCFLKSQPHAAIHLAVETTARHKAFRPLKNLVNAVLRRAQREWDEQNHDPLANVPSWLLESWLNSYGPEKTQRLAEAMLLEPPLDLSFKSPNDLADFSYPVDRTILGTARLISPGRIERLPGYDDGVWWVQDLAASLPAYLLNAREGQIIADLCAAPGGKTAQLAASGAIVTAVDISANRLTRLKDNLDRLNLSATCVKADLRKWQPGRRFDGILLDAPCSATGTIRRHPDLLHTKKPDDITKLAALQADLLDRAVSWLKPGGTLIYCTCSLQQEEGENQISAALSRHSDLHLDPISRDELPDLEDCVSLDGTVRALPFHCMFEADWRLSGMDGFFIARLVKKNI